MYNKLNKKFNMPNNVKYLDYNGLDLYHNLEKQYIDNKVNSGSIENDQIDNHNTGISVKTKVKVNINNNK